jgi:hypothetical protein
MAEIAEQQAQQIFTQEYAPEDQKRFLDAYKVRDCVQARAILQQFPFPPRIGAGTKTEMRQRIAFNRLYHRTMWEGHIAIDRMLYEESLKYRAPGDP